MDTKWQGTRTVEEQRAISRQDLYDGIADVATAFAKASDLLQDFTKALHDGAKALQNLRDGLAGIDCYDHEIRDSLIQAGFEVP